MQSSIITWFTAAAPSKDQLAVHQYLYKFQTNNGHGLFVESKKYVHGTLHFDLRDNAIEKYTLGFALNNKKWLKTRIEHQLIAQTKKPARIPKKNYWYSIDLENSDNE